MTAVIGIGLALGFFLLGCWAGVDEGRGEMRVETIEDLRDRAKQYRARNLVLEANALEEFADWLSRPPYDRDRARRAHLVAGALEMR